MTGQLPKKQSPGWYYRLSSFFREHFGSSIHKIPVDAGFSCPNRNDVTGKTGCTYCYNPAFAPQTGSAAGSVAEQIAHGKKNRKSALYLAYFQAYTNTYGPFPLLKSLYKEALQDPEVTGLSIATRPDCITTGVLDLLQSYARDGCHIWIEYGLQSAHDATLERINRGHTFNQFKDAVEITRGRGIFICAHIILGLPGESRAMIMETIHQLNKCLIDGIKFHHLQVIRGTPLAEQYRTGSVTVFKNASAYIDLLCDCLEVLSPHVTIHRLAARVTDDALLIAPCWPESAVQLAAAVETELRHRGSWQGSALS